MSTARLKKLLDKGHADALKHEDALTAAYEQALDSIAREAAGRFEQRAMSLTAAAPAPEATMVALYPSREQAAALAQPNGEPAEILHVTLAFLGKLSVDQAEYVAAVIRDVAPTLEPLQGEVGGLACFGGLAAIFDEVARIAADVAPEGGYGQTLWHPQERVVLWIPADWTTEEEMEIAAGMFLTVPAVEAVEIGDAEQAVPGEPWELIWAAGAQRSEALYPSIVLPDVPGLVELRAVVCEALVEAGVPYSEDHGYTAHLTIAYTERPSTPPAALFGVPLTFDYVSVTRNDVARDFPLGASPLVAAGPPPWHPPHDDEIMDVDEIISRLRTKTDPVRRAAIEAAVMPALETVRADFDVTNPYVKRVLENTGAEIVGVGETTRLNVLRIIDRSYEEGLTIPDTAKAIREGMFASDETRAETIAKTELAQLANGGTLASAQIVANETGLVLFKQWKTAPGAPHPRHEEYDDLDGQTVTLDGVFQVGGAQLEYPGDPAGPPEETINCRCVLVMVEEQPTAPTAMIDDSTPDTEEGLVEALSNVDVPAIKGDSSARLAASLVRRASTVEPLVTKLLQRATAPRGGVLEGLSFRLKTPESTARKIKLMAKEQNTTIAQSAKGQKDGLRFTAVYGEKDFVPKMEATLRDLRKKGLTVARVRHTWGHGRDYVGTNIVMRTPKGYEFELQFHTPQSLKVKEVKNHPLYEEWRKLDEDSPRALELDKQMIANDETIVRPPGVLDWKYEDAFGPIPPEAEATQLSAATPAKTLDVKPWSEGEILNAPEEKLWDRLSELGKSENAARAEIADEAQLPIIEELWQREIERETTFEGRTRSLRYADINGDQQVHSHYSDGHSSIETIAIEAAKRGQTRIVISDHSHLLTLEDIRSQHVEIDRVNGRLARGGYGIQVEKGIEVNILADGTLDTADDILSQFDTVNASIHAPQQALGGQLTLFQETNTERLLKALDNPNVKVLVHPHSVDADWNKVAKKAAKKGVALEINGRDMLRNSRQEPAAKMIKAAKEHGAKLVIGSDAHTPNDLIDALYAVRFAREHGVTKDDLAAFQLRDSPQTFAMPTGQLLTTPAETVELKISSRDASEKTAVKEALASLEQVIRAPVPDNAKVRIFVRGDAQGFQGFFRPPAQTSAERAILGPEGKTPVIGIKRTTDDHYETLVHEYGHYLDYLFAGEGRRGADLAGNFESARTVDRFGARLARGEEIVEADTGLRDVLLAAEDSAWITNLRAALKPDGRNDFFVAVPVESGTVHAGSREYVEYLLTPYEIFARAFTQWMNLRDPRLAATVARKLALRDSAVEGEKLSGAAFFYWREEDFKPIAEALDAYFARQGMLVQPLPRSAGG